MATHSVREAEAWGREWHNSWLTKGEGRLVTLNCFSGLEGCSPFWSKFSLALCRRARPWQSTAVAATAARRVWGGTAADAGGSGLPPRLSSCRRAPPRPLASPPTHAVHCCRPPPNDGAVPPLSRGRGRAAASGGAGTRSGGRRPPPGLGERAGELQFRWMAQSWKIFFRL